VVAGAALVHFCSRTWSGAAQRRPSSNMFCRPTQRSGAAHITGDMVCPARRAGARRRTRAPSCAERRRRARHPARRRRRRRARRQSRRRWASQSCRPLTRRLHTRPRRCCSPPCSGGAGACYSGQECTHLLKRLDLSIARRARTRSTGLLTERAAAFGGGRGWCSASPEQAHPNPPPPPRPPPPP